MKKTTAISLLGGTTATSGRLVGCSAQAVSKWPKVLPRRLADRVIAAVVRQLVVGGPVRSRSGVISLPPELCRYLCSHVAPRVSAETAPNDTAPNTLDAAPNNNAQQGKRYATASRNLGA